MPIYKSPQNIQHRDGQLKSVFLAGSIEMDKAIHWQKACEVALTNSYNVFNPRRIEWDASWKQEISNPSFRRQVEWELDALEQSDIIIMFFAENTKSPISLLEFGLFAKANKMLVVCEKEFWRKGNVDIVCQKYGIPQFKTLDELLVYLLETNLNQKEK